MTEYVFRAADSESAMDNAIRELGSDALILSVKRVGDMVEVRAIKEALASVGARGGRDAPPPPPKPNSATRRSTEEGFAQNAIIKKIDLDEALSLVGKFRAREEQARLKPIEDSQHTVDVLAQSDSLPAPLVHSADPAAIQSSPEYVPDAAELEAMFRQSGSDHASPEFEVITNIQTSSHYSDWAAEDNTQAAAGLQYDTASPSDKAPASLSTAEAHPEWGWSQPAEDDVEADHFTQKSDDALSLNPPKPFRKDDEDHTAEQTRDKAAFNADQEPPFWDMPAPPVPEPDYESRNRYDTPDNTPVAPRGIALPGFPSDIVTACQIRAEKEEGFDALTYACGLLADRLVRGRSPGAGLDGDILFVFGPPGAGKTTIAAKLAFEFIQNHAIRPSLVRLHKESFVEDGKLRRYAKLLNAQFSVHKMDEAVPLFERTIIDCDLNTPEAIQKAFAGLEKNNPGLAIVPVLVIPGTWSVFGIKHYCQSLPAISPITVLSQMDIGGIGVGGLSTLAHYGVDVVAASDSDRMSDGFLFVDKPSIEQFLQEAFHYTDEQIGQGF
jgi:flagellar biosynthesis GTPase FlhF